MKAAKPLKRVPKVTDGSSKHRKTGPLRAPHAQTHTIGRGIRPAKIVFSPAKALSKKHPLSRGALKKLSTKDPYAAPVGAVIVYGGRDAGHVELRTESGFASDFASRRPYPRPVLGIYVKPA